MEENEYNCLSNLRIIVRHINRQRGSITDPKHVLYGGMADRAVRIFTVPKLQSGTFVNVLTNKEKDFLERTMGLEYNALSVHKKEDNFWSDRNPNGINRVRLTKQDNYLDLSIPEDYIKYKILLANKDFICPSLLQLQETPKATYQFVIVKDGDDLKETQQKLSVTARCYKEYGKIEDNIDVLKYIIETMDGRPVAASTKLEFLLAKAYEAIQADSKLFLSLVTDPVLKDKVLLRKAVEAGIVYKKGDYYYLKQDNSPLCNPNEEPTFAIAVRFLSLPKNLQLKFSIEAKLNEK